MSRCLPFICVVLIFTSAARAEDKQEIYKWTDDSGEIHYTQVPPQDREYEKMRNTSPPADNPDQVRSKLQEQVEAMDKQQQEQAEGARDAEQWANIQKIRRSNCETARKNLANLQLGGSRRYMTPEGQVIHLTEDERVERIDRANKQIAENCEE